MELINEKIVGWYEAKKMLDKKAKEKELGYEQKNAQEHLAKFCKLGEKKTSELLKDLGKIEKLKERHKFYITNLLPSTQDELKALLAHEIVNLTEEDQKKILTIVKKFT